MTRIEKRRAAGAMLFCGFEGNSLDAALKDLLKEVQPSGMIFFSRNFESLEHLSELTEEIKRWRSPSQPILCSIDQEGGRVARMKEPATIWPAMAHLGATNDTILAEQVGQALGKEVRAVNMDLNFAPVLDIHSNHNNPIIGHRAFHHTPQRVGAIGVALAQGMQHVGIAACGKHFPGHGDTDLDSHLELPILQHEQDRLEHFEWLPFQQAIQAKIASLMTAHVLLPQIDQTIATLSTKLIQHTLREKMNFQGIVFSDDIEMKALAEPYTIETIAEQGILAGIDIFLACKQATVVEQMYRAIVQTLEQDKIDPLHIQSQQQRIQTFVEQYYLPPQPYKQTCGVLGCPEHQRLAQKMAAHPIAPIPTS